MALSIKCTFYWWHQCRERNLVISDLETALPMLQFMVLLSLIRFKRQADTMHASNWQIQDSAIYYNMFRRYLASCSEVWHITNGKFHESQFKYPIMFTSARMFSFPKERTWSSVGQSMEYQISADLWQIWMGPTEPLSDTCTTYLKLLPFKLLGILGAIQAHAMRAAIICHQNPEST